MDVIYLNGDFVGRDEAKISVFDTGFYYGDGIYEVALLHKGKVIDLNSHLERLTYVLNEVKFKNAPRISELESIAMELVKRNSIQNGMVYIQITRGISMNRYAKPGEIKQPTVVAYVVPVDLQLENLLERKINYKLVPDPRRLRRDIKMTSLMPMILSKIEANEEGFDYVLFYDRETKAVTEGASSNLFIVKHNDVVYTHPVGHKILAGCTRKKAIELMRAGGFEVREEPFYEAELYNAKEAFVTGAIKLFVPVLNVNRKIIGNGQVGEMVKFCYNKYLEFIKNS